MVHDLTERHRVALPRDHVALARDVVRARHGVQLAAVQVTHDTRDVHRHLTTFGTGIIVTNHHDGPIRKCNQRQRHGILGVPASETGHVRWRVRQSGRIDGEDLRLLVAFAGGEEHRAKAMHGRRDERGRAKAILAGGGIDDVLATHRLECRIERHARNREIVFVVGEQRERAVTVLDQAGTVSRATEHERRRLRQHVVTADDAVDVDAGDEALDEIRRDGPVAERNGRRLAADDVIAVVGASSEHGCKRTCNHGSCDPIMNSLHCSCILRARRPVKKRVKADICTMPADRTFRDDMTTRHRRNRKTIFGSQEPATNTSQVCLDARAAHVVCSCRQRARAACA